MDAMPRRHKRRSARRSANGGKRLSHPAMQPAFLSATTYFLLLTLFGGGAVGWTPGYILLMAATIAGSLLFVWKDGLAALARLSTPARYALVGIAILPLLQLAPLPPALWHALPGQDLREHVLALIGLDHSWQPLSLAPVATALTAILAMGFVLMLLLMVRLDDAAFRRLMLVAQAIVVLGTLVGLSQVVTGGQFPNLHGEDTGGVLVGFYANKNHMALILAVSILLFAFVTGPDLLGRRALPATLGYIAFALVCIVATNSRAGLILGLVATVVSLSDLIGRIPWRYRLAGIAAVAVLAGIVVSTTAFTAVSNRFGDVDSDLRWRFVAWSWPLAERHWLLGSGAGSFPTLFMTQEQLQWVMPTFVNHTHNEYLELLIEFGIPGCGLALLLAASIIGPIVHWRSLPRRDPRHAEMMFGFAAIVLIALHNLVDYPLRRPAAWAFLALALAAIYRGQTTSAKSWMPSRRLATG